MKGAQNGVGLPELMISLFIASLIMTALIQHYVSTKQHYGHLQSTLDDATALQLSIDFMRNSIQQAGFTPCLSINQLITVDNRDGDKPLTAIDLHPSAQPLLQINRMSADFETIISLKSNTEILASHTKTLHLGHPIVIADCNHAEVHTIREAYHTNTTQWITLNTPLVFQYETPIYIGEWIEEQFFVRKQGGLFYHYHHTDELTAHVKSMLPSVQNTPQGLFVHVVLGVDKQMVQVDTRVRAG
ncbi:MAG TPA: prepilin cleavage protein [Legionella sp.]|nr:prepilin cleavage protein [Legionella sp.]